MDRGEQQLTGLLARASVLVVDDEPGMRNFLVKTLTPHCLSVAEAGNTVEAEAELARRHFDVMILDNMMPGQRGLDWLAEQRGKGGFTDTVMVTAYADLETAIEAMRAGAADFVLKPFRSNQLLNAVGRCIQMAQLRRENMLLRRELDGQDIGQQRRELIGSSPAIAATRDMLARIRDVTTPVLITGASGTGKEVAARHMHVTSHRSAAPFVPINCSAIPAEMIESELFGHVAGAFPGAGAAREGLLPSAQGGTVFLDDVAGLSPSAQSALRRVLEDGTVRPVGAERETRLDLRFVLATSRALDREVAEGRFREDLFFRINVIELRMPALAEREGDIIELAALFLREIASRLDLPRLEIDSTTRAALLRHNWPGNIRELRNFIERSLIFGRFPLETLAPPSEQGPIEPLMQVERREILRALDATGGNRSEAARRLGVSRKTIDRKCAAWGL
ncbi:sigma-54-dependent Fis family transcriptional regulator [Paracoccus saliphilus]|uniref:Sigma-54-dependent Fis family transcriptional regulator n=1 Tax=Paracoccus saliphilus TaxID=405559 RepID=A0ABY7S842_9RHOB|nr:sigma-54 dependent transcriptional regulator [Paracoccus saliphilus]WCR02697.1 sigma-54-dependent Fis family transcriptional regulator [Paracoccus saliphilus]